MYAISVLIAILLAGVSGGSLKVIDPYSGEDISDTPEWMLFPDGDGKLHLIHLREDPSQPTPRFNAMTDISFLLFTRKSPNKAERLLFGNASSVEAAGFDSRKETFFICHGWSNHANSPVNVLIRDAYLKAGDYNVIVVDWNVGAAANYFSARGHAATVGQHTSDFINFLVKELNASLKRMHLIGHSLGAHAVGIAGKAIQKSANTKVRTIIGLDPASPLYTVSNFQNRLNFDDAEYVEVMHTNGGNLGFWAALGVADFYPNMGTKQPGCGFDFTGSCSHARAYQYYAESVVNHGAFRALRCNDVPEMQYNGCPEDKNVYLMGGHYTKSKTEGVFYLETADKAPFSLR